MSRRARVAVWFWIAGGVVAWNLTFDFLMTRGVKEYLYRQAEHDAGFGPRVTIDEIMRETIADGVVVATGVGLAVTGAGLATIACLRRDQQS